MDTREGKRAYGRIRRAAALLLAALLLCALACGCGAERQKLTVLMYHHVVADGEECSSVTVTENRLREDLAWLADNGWKTVLPRELVSGEVVPDGKTVLITFDDGYRSNYEYLYPLLLEYGQKAEIAVITGMIDANAEMFLTWDMMREMADSGLVEFGSHTHGLHNPDTGGEYKQGEANGVQQIRGESKAAYIERVRTDLETSVERLSAELGTRPLCFAYPFGARDRRADKEVDRLFAVSFLTDLSGPSAHAKGWKRMRRVGVDMQTPLSELLR